MFVKFTIVLFVVYLLTKFGLIVWSQTLPEEEKIRILNNKFSDDERQMFLAVGLIRITTYLCVIISAGIVLFKMIGGFM